MLQTFDRTRMSDRPIILWGGAIYGEIAYQVITRIYEGTVETVIDNKYSSVPWADMQVIRSSSLKDYHGVDVLICAANAYDIIKDEIAKYAENDIKAYDIKEILKEYKKMYDRHDVLNSYIYGDIDLDEIILKYEYYAGIPNGYDEMLYLPYCVMCITNKCSLRCRNCAAFISKYRGKKDYGSDYLIQNFSKIVDAVDGITELELMGGEPFLHEDFNTILEWCINQKKIRAIKIITNGTIIPPQETWEWLKNFKVKLVVDDYGELSRNIEKIFELAEQYGVRCERQKLQTWYQIEPINKKNFSEDELKEIFYGCNFKTCIGMTNGRFYHCNVSGHMNTVGLLPDEDADYIQIEGENWETDDLRNKIRLFIKKDYLKACDYCNYSSKIEIAVAEQEN